LEADGSSSPNIARAFLLAASVAIGAGAPDPVVNPVVLTGVARCPFPFVSVANPSSPNILPAAAKAVLEGPATAFPFPVENELFGATGIG
jgi:hypothetical protein